jgi:hypothetical protein
LTTEGFHLQNGSVDDPKTYRQNVQKIQHRYNRRQEEGEEGIAAEESEVPSSHQVLPPPAGGAGGMYGLMVLPRGVLRGDAEPLRGVISSELASDVLIKIKM